MSVYAILSAAAARHPGKPALVDEFGGEVSYGELLRRVDNFGASLDALGLERLSRVGIVLPSGIDYVVAHFAIARAALVAVHIAPQAAPAELRHMLALSRPAALVTSEDFDAAALPIEGGATILRAGQEGLGAKTHATAVQLPRRVTPCDPLAITFSGGSTGLPKGVVTSHGARCATARLLAAVFDVDADDVVGVATPLFHSAGLFSWLTPAIQRGNTIALLSRWSAEGLARLVALARVTKLFLVPTQMYDLAFASQPLPELAALRGVFHAAAPASDALIARFASRWPAARLTEFYGLSETGTIAVNRGGPRVGESRSVGRAVDVAHVRVVDPSGATLPPGEVGEIVVAGDQTFLGYLGDPAASARAFQYGPGWFATGDLGFVDEARDVTLRGREKEVVNRGGVKFFPAEVENAVMAHGGIAECAVVPMHDERLGAVPVAAIVLSPDYAGGAEGIVTFLLEHISGVKRPVRFLIMEALPRTAAAKVDRQGIKRDIQASAPLMIHVVRDLPGRQMTAA